MRVLPYLAMASLSLAAVGSAHAQTPGPPAAIHDVQLWNISPEATGDLIRKVKQAQEALRRGDDLYFQLLSGAPASYPMTETSPREAFLNADFSRPFEVRRVEEPDNPLWKRHKVTLIPNGLGNLMWDVEVVMGVNDNIERVEMFYRPPPPF